MPVPGTGRAIMATMTRDEWIEHFAGQLGVEAPDAATIEALLAVAADAAHSSERTAAPIACYLVGRAGATTDQALAAARAVTA
jgi:hypothetical protein